MIVGWNFLSCKSQTSAASYATTTEFWLDDSPPELSHSYRLKETLAKYFEDKIQVCQKYIAVSSSAVRGEGMQLVAEPKRLTAVLRKITIVTPLTKKQNFPKLDMFDEVP